MKGALKEDLSFLKKRGSQTSVVGSLAAPILLRPMTALGLSSLLGIPERFGNQRRGVAATAAVSVCV
ncbi:hypothetical protein MRX96_018032 [Rhipicephalus microplus]